MHPVVFFNTLALLCLSIALAFAFGAQFLLSELPCPLCMLQRVALCAVAFGFLLNVRLGARPLHYGIILFASLFGTIASARQVLLHIAPGTGSYGSAFFGLHYYTWGVVIFILSIAGVAFLLLIDRQDSRTVVRNRITDAACIIAMALTFANALNAFLQCGPIECADNPVNYWIMVR